MNKFFLFVFFLVSCVNRDNVNKDQIPQETAQKIRFVMGKLNIDTTKDQYIVFIPAENGCGSCLILSKQLINDISKEKSFKAVISAYSNKKLSLYVKNLRHLERVIIDSNANAISSGLINEYPLIIRVMHGKFTYSSLVTASTIDSVRFKLNMPKGKPFIK